MSEDFLAAEKLQTDPRVVEAKRLLREAVHDHQSALTGIRGSLPGRTRCYAEMLERATAVRGGSLFFPYLGSGLGRGALVELADGSVKYDMITGIGVHVFGHSDEDLVNTGVDAAIADSIMQGNLQQNADPALFSEELVSVACESGAALRHCFLSTSGATANENALKMLFQAKAPANRLLTFSNTFAGRTMALSQVTDRPQNRVGLPTVLAVDYVPFFDSADPEGSIARSLAALREHLARYPGLHAGMMMEPIQGEGGYYVAASEFFVALCDELRRHKIPVYFDEVQTFGRTSRMFAFQHLGLDEYADVATVGKMTQVCATLFRDELTPKPGLVSQTFTGSTSSIMAARSILRRLRQGNYYGPDGRIAQIHARFVQHFNTLHAKYPEAISGPWGLGGMVAFTAFGGDAAKTKLVMNRLYEAGVITFVAGDNPKRIRMLPPLGAVTDEDIDNVCGILGNVLEHTRS